MARSWAGSYALWELTAAWRRLWTVVFASAMGVALITSVLALQERVEVHMKQDASALIAGDARLSSDHPIADSFVVEAERLGLTLGHSIIFASMAASGEMFHLVQAKAVGGAYPVRGRMELAGADGAFGTEEGAVSSRVEPGGGASETGGLFSSAAQALPKPGEAWLEEEALEVLGLKLGDRMELGEASFVVSAVIVSEPDRASEALRLGPRVMINAQDLDATGLLGFGSRAAYRLHLGGDAAVVAEYRQWAEKRLERGQRLDDARDARPELRSAFDKAASFLALAALLAFFLAGLAIFNTVKGYLDRRMPAIAALRCMGGQTGQIVLAHLYQILALVLAGAILGAWAASLIGPVLPWILGGILPQGLPSGGWWPVVAGFAVGVLAAVSFTLPPLAAIRQVPALVVLRRHSTGGLAPNGEILAWTVGVGAWLLGVFLLVGDAVLAAVAVASVFALLAATALAFLAFAWALRVLTSRSTSLIVRFGVANVTRAGSGAPTTAAGLAVGFFAVFSLYFAYFDLLPAWREDIPRDAPNVFAINVLPEQREGFSTLFAKRDLAVPELFPVIRGRLLSVDGALVSQMHFTNTREQHLAEREFNLSMAAHMQKDNQIIAGKWWDENGAAAGAGDTIPLSVEERVATAVGAKLGSRLRFRVAGQEFTGTVTSLRKVRWDSFNPNFFVVAPAGTLDSFPALWLTSFHMSEQRGDLQKEMVRSFPNITVIDVNGVLVQVQSVLQRVTALVGLVLAFSLVSGLLVLYTTVELTRARRAREGALLRTLGARERHVVGMTMVEFALVGGVAAFIGMAGAVVVVKVLAWRAFGLEWLPSLWAVLAIPGVGALAAVLAAVVSLRGTLRAAPAQALRGS